MTPSWKIDATKILDKSEIAAVLADLKRKKRSVNTRQNLSIFRLATCCGLRVTEICGLRLSDIRLGIRRPYLRIRKQYAKNKRPRRVPLWWDRGTLADLESWQAERKDQGATSSDFFACAQSKAAFGNQLTRQNVRKRFISSCAMLGTKRQAELTIHHGRHSFISHALAGGRSLAEVRDAAGHNNISTTSVYTHVAVDDDGKVGDLFDFEDKAFGLDSYSRAVCPIVRPSRIAQDGRTQGKPTHGPVNYRVAFL